MKPEVPMPRGAGRVAWARPATNSPGPSSGGAGQPASDERAVLTEAAFDLVHRGCGGSVRLLLELIDLLGRAKGKRLGKTAVGNALAMLSGTRLDASSTTGWTSKERAERAEGVDAEEVTA